MKSITITIAGIISALVVFLGCVLWTTPTRTELVSYTYRPGEVMMDTVYQPMNIFGVAIGEEWHSQDLTPYWQSKYAEYYVAQKG